MSTVVRAFATPIGCALLLGCGGLIAEPSDITPDTPSDAQADAADATVEAPDAASDATDVDSPAEADIDATDWDVSADAVDDRGDASPDAANPYNDITQPSNWSLFDTTSVNAKANGFAGGTFDGRYVYMVANVAAQYDTHAPFTAASSWTTFDASNLNSATLPFEGGAFDGHYVYLAGQVVARYDPKGTFANKTSWLAFDTRTLPAGSYVNGAVFDGRYLYFVGDTICRYDTQQPFTAASSWSTFDMSRVTKRPRLVGGAFDGRFVYFAPADYQAPVARYDTTGAFSAVSSWSTVDLSGMFPDAVWPFSAAFDGRFLYLFSNEAASPSIGSQVVRYDTTAAFAAAASWSAFGTAAIAFPGYQVYFEGAAFDGRDVYGVPALSPPFVSRYDDLGSFSDAGSWSWFDTSTLAANAHGYWGAVFDGRYVYLVPSGGAQGSVAARFDARTPPLMPKLPGWSGSFF